jgi:hypothetical protein
MLCTGCKRDQAQVLKRGAHGTYAQPCEHDTLGLLLQVLLAQAAGASGALVYNSQGSRLLRMNASLPACQQPDIPAVFVGVRAGLGCARAARTGFTCEAHILPVRSLPCLPPCAT